MRFLNQYLEIEKIRSGRSIRVSEEIPMDAAGAAVPNFIIQPIVEELISRAAAQTGAQHTVTVRAERIEEDLEISIEDRCAGLNNGPEAAAEHEAVLEITRERLVQLYGGHHGLTARSQSDGAARVMIRIPFRETHIQSEETLVAETVL
jgi:two-component system LytT family sensor kinase